MTFKLSLLTLAFAPALSLAATAPLESRLSDGEAKLLTELQRTLETDAAATAAQDRTGIEAQILDQGTRRASLDQLPPED